MAESRRKDPTADLRRGRNARTTRMKNEANLTQEEKEALHLERSERNKRLWAEGKMGNSEKQSASREKWCREHPLEVAASTAKARKGLRKKNTQPERKIHSILHKLGITHERWYLSTVTCTSVGCVTHEFDFYLPDFDIFIEADGCYWHCCPSCFPEPASNALNQVVLDALLENVSRGCGLTVLRFWAHDILHNTEYVEGTILRECLKESSNESKAS